MTLSEITFKKLYAQITFNLKKLYNKAGSSFSLASPFGMVLSTITDLFSLNTLNIQNVQRSFDVNDPMNQNEKALKAIAKIGQYNPTRGTSATGSIKIKLKAGVDINEDIQGGKIIFANRAQLKNQKNNLNYMLDLNQDTLIFTLSNQTPIVLNIVQGIWEQQTFTGTGERNQSFSAIARGTKELDNYRFNLYVNSELWAPKKHKFDMLTDEKAYVPYTSYTGGVDIIFGNDDEGMMPGIGDIIVFEYILTDGQDGNLVDPVLNEFQMIDEPTDYYGNDIDMEQFFDIDINTNVTFGKNGESVEYLKSILPYISSNFVLAGVNQYEFFLKRLGFFSIVNVYTTSINSFDLINNIYLLLKSNTDLLNQINSNDNSTSMLQLVQTNLNEVQLIRKLLLTEGGDNLVNIFLIPDIRNYYGQDTDTNYFNIDVSYFILDDDEKSRILNYLSTEGIQIITNEVKIIDPVLTKYIMNVTVRIFDDAVVDNIINNIVDAASDYFINQTRRDRIPPSDLERIIDGIDGIDSLDVSFLSEDNENYHKEFLIKADQFQKQNSRYPADTEIIMSDGKTYNRNAVIGLDPILGDIIILPEELPIIRGGFTDRYNNNYNILPGIGSYSSINIMVLPDETPRKNTN